MSELDQRQQVILESWKRGELVKGHSVEIGIESAMMDAVSVGNNASVIYRLMCADKPAIQPIDVLDSAIKLVAREIAARQMGYPYLMDAEEAEKSQAAPIEDFVVRIKSTTEAKLIYSVEGEDIEVIVDMEAEYDEGEEMSFERQGMPKRAEIINVFGLSIAEQHEYDKWMLENDIEPELIKVFEGRE